MILTLPTLTTRFILHVYGSKTLDVYNFRDSRFSSGGVQLNIPECDVF